MSRPPVKAVSWIATILAVAASMGMAGCRSDGADGGPDIGYIRVPSVRLDRTQPAIPVPLPQLLPSEPAYRWELALRLGDRVLTEQIRVGPSPAVVAKLPNTLTLQMRQNNSPLVYRSETFQVTEKDIRLAAIGGIEKMVLSPPLPLVHATTPPDKAILWKGSLTYGTTLVPAQAVSRISTPEQIKTPAGTFTAYRVDTLLRATFQGKVFSFPTSRWFAPGVGIVKQSFRIGNVPVAKELTAYKGKNQ